MQGVLFSLRKVHRQTDVESEKRICSLIMADSCSLEWELLWYLHGINVNNSGSGLVIL